MAELLISLVIAFLPIFFIILVIIYGYICKRMRFANDTPDLEASFSPGSNNEKFYKEDMTDHSSMNDDNIENAQICTCMTHSNIDRAPTPEERFSHGTH